MLPAVIESTPWSIRPLSPRAHRLTLTFDQSRQTRKILLTSDHHWDASTCRREVLRRDLQDAVDQQAPWFAFGDTFDAMQGKFDPRGSKSACRPELSSGAYYDLCVSEAARWYAPYASNLALKSPGNHETAVLKKCETNITSRFVAEMQRHNPDAQLGRYWGFVQIVAEAPYLRTSDCRVLHYHHGYGGGGEATRGLLDNNRTRGQYLADYFVSGHIHRRNDDENVLIGLNRMGDVEKRSQYFLRTSTYKAEEDEDGYHAEKGRSARPLGGWWLEVTMRRHHAETVFHWRHYRT